MTQINQYKTRSTNEGSSSPKGSADNPYTLEEYNAFEEGTWPGGYVETKGYVLPEVVIEGGSGSEPDSSCSSEPDSEPTDNRPSGGGGYGGGGNYGGGSIDLGGGASDGSTTGGTSGNSSGGTNSGNNNSTGGNSNSTFDPLDELVDKIEVPVELADAIASAAKEYAGNTQIGSNGKLYIQKSSGKVFRGNQYVTTTSLSGLGKSINKVLGPIGLLISAYNVAESYSQEGVDGAIDAFNREILAECDVVLGACIGSYISPVIGTTIGAAVAGILSSCGVSITDYFVEISFDKPIKE